MYKTLFFSVVFITLTLPLFFQSANAVTSVNVPAALAKPANNASVLDVDFLKAKINSSLGLTVVKVEKTAVPGIA
ncbi:MAG: thiol:disulfide interchange protein DsbC, partial [Colwellia sp.]